MGALIAEAGRWGLALVPVVLLLLLFVWLDAFKLMRFGEVLTLLLLGGAAGIAAYPVSGRLLDTLPIGFSSYSRFVAPWIEEAIKCAIVVLLFRFNRIGYKIDAVICGFAIGAGFSVVENIIYLTVYPQYGTGTWLVRGLGTAIMHGTTVAILAAIAHELAERETRDSAGDFQFNLLWFLPGYVVAVALHTAFNQFPDRPMLAMMAAAVIAPIAIMTVLQLGTAEARRWLVAERSEHKAQLEALRAGIWPETPAGRKIAALAERADPETARRMRRYWELQAWLVAEAERLMLDESAGDAILEPTQVRSAFAELDGLRRALGKSSVAALTALLPFSRNDQWEVAELRQRIS